MTTKQVEVYVFIVKLLGYYDKLKIFLCRYKNINNFKDHLL